MVLKSDINVNEPKKLLYFRLIVQDKLDISFLKNVTQDNFIHGLYSIEKNKENEDIIKEIFNLKQENKIVFQTKSSCIPAF